jgi:hypothetical protein
MTAARDPLREAEVREQFCAWHKVRHGYMLGDEKFFHDGGLQAQRWEVWQEATRRASARAAEICDEVYRDARDQYKGRGKYAPDNPYRADTYMDGFSDGAARCAELLAAAAPEEKEAGTTPSS